MASRAQTTLSPTNGPRRGIPNVLPLRVVGDTFVQHHRDVASQSLLNLNDALWGKEMIGAIEMRLKPNPLLRKFSHCSQAEDLITPAVRQNRSIPAHEAMQPAQFANQLRAWAEIEMIGITQQNLAAHFF